MNYLNCGTLSLARNIPRQLETVIDVADDCILFYTKVSSRLKCLKYSLKGKLWSSFYLHGYKKKKTQNLYVIFKRNEYNEYRTHVGILIREFTSHL